MRALIVLLLLPFAAADCIDLIDGQTIGESTTLCGSTYDIPNGIVINTSNVVLDCAGSILRGNSGESNIGIKIEDAQNVTVKNCNILTFSQGLYLTNVQYSSIIDNSILKNRIGIRMLDAFENVIAQNNDKSHQLPVSAINSRFNVVMMSNRNIDREFCEVNACNTNAQMNVCVSNDLYCSVQCSYEADTDCPRPKEQIAEPKKQEESIPEKIKEPEVEKVNVTKPAELKEVNERKIPLVMQVFIYVVLYGFAFLVFRLKK